MMHQSFQANYKISALPVTQIDTNVLSDDMSRLDFILSCRENRNRTDCHKSLSHSLTNIGICTAYNAVSNELVYDVQTVNYLKDTNEIFNTPKAANPMPANAYGKRGGIMLILDTHQSEIFGSNRGYFQVKINHYNKLPMLK